jgi:hypothetical protein
LIECKALGLREGRKEGRKDGQKTGDEGMEGEGDRSY